MSVSGFADEGWHLPEGPPLPRRERRWTVTRESLARALGRVWPITDEPDLAHLAGLILAELPPALSLPWPVDTAPVPVPDHGCSFLAQDPQGRCKHCGKTWARNVAELNLDAALAALYATEPAPQWDAGGLDRLRAAVFQCPPAEAERGHGAASGTVPVSVDPDTLSVAPEATERDHGRAL